jgi:4-hydroxybutyrate CoA-transferase
VENPLLPCHLVTNKGESKIVNQLKPGSGVVTTRAHVHYIVTEYGVADLYGKNIKQRVRELIKIAHPNYRETLIKEAFNTLKIIV